MSLLHHAERWLPRRERTYRVSIDFPRSSMERLHAIKRLTDAGCDQAVIWKALIVYEELLDAYLSGDDVVIRRRDGTEQSVFDDSEPVQ